VLSAALLSVAFLSAREVTAAPLRCERYGGLAVGAIPVPSWVSPQPAIGTWSPMLTLGCGAPVGVGPLRWTLGLETAPYYRQIGVHREVLPQWATLSAALGVASRRSAAAVFLESGFSLTGPGFWFDYLPFTTSKGEPFGFRFRGMAAMNFALNLQGAVLFTLGAKQTLEDPP
jgi:hypothetical protein